MGCWGTTRTTPTANRPVVVTKNPRERRGIDPRRFCANLWHIADLGWLGFATARPGCQQLLRSPPLLWYRTRRGLLSPGQFYLLRKTQPRCFVFPCSPPPPPNR